MWLFRQHFLQCPQGFLNKHFEKLIQCDMRLNCLSRQPEIILDSPYFESRSLVFEDPDELKGIDFGQGETGKGSTNSGFQNIASPAAAQSSSLEIEKGDSAGITSENMSREAPSSSSGTIRSLGIVFDVLMDKVSKLYSLFAFSFIYTFEVQCLIRCSV